MQNGAILFDCGMANTHGGGARGAGWARGLGKASVLHGLF
jgi:hypothetical protein